MKRFLSLCLAAALAFGAMATAVFASNEDRLAFEADVSNNERSGITYLDEQVLETSVRVLEVRAKDGFGGKFFPEIEGTAERNGTYYTTISANWEFDWPSLKTGAVFEDTVLCVLDSGKGPVELPSTLTITGDPVADLDVASEDLLYDNLKVGNSYLLTARLADRWNTLQGKSWGWVWSIEEEGSAFAKIEPVGSDGNKLTSQARLTLLGAGVFSLSIDVLDNSTGDYLTGMTYHDISPAGADLTPLPGEQIAQAESDLAEGKPASLDVDMNEGITAEQFADLKAAAAQGGSSQAVELTFGGNADMTLSFDPSEVDGSWSGTFTPSFTPAPPEEAKDLGYNSRFGRWLNFYYSGDLPAPMTVTMKVPAGFYPEDTDVLKVWYYDDSRECLVEQPITVVYNKAKGTVTFTLDHFSAYAIYPEGVDPNENLVPPSGKRSAGGSGNTEIKQNRENRLNAFAATAAKISSLPTREVTIGGETFTASILTANSSEIPYIYYDVMERIAGRENLVLEIILEDGKTVLVPAKRLPKPEIYRIYYTLSDLAKLA